VNGRLVTGRFPYVELTIHLPTRTISIEALLDTGFDGSIALPVAALPELDRPAGFRDWEMADGTVVRAPYIVGMANIRGLDS